MFPTAFPVAKIDGTVSIPVDGLYSNPGVFTYMVLTFPVEAETKAG